jgi:arabinosaccharide transport system substrate-binding protein
LVIAGAASVLVLVTARAAPDRPDIVVAVSARAHAVAYEAALPAFEEKHGVDVQVQFVNYRSLETRLQNAILSGAEIPDLTELPFGALGFFTRGPSDEIGLMDLTELVEKDQLAERLVETRFAGWTARDRIYALPHDVHPVMLTYRRDLVEQLGINVAELKTWDDFVAMGRRITKDLDGDGIPDRYAIDMRKDGGDSLRMLIYQRGGNLFDSSSNVVFDSELVAETIEWFIDQVHGPEVISYEAGWGQTQMKAMTDGLVLFYWTPDWRSYYFAKEGPHLAGKLALMPLPAWEEGGRRTTTWGGTGLTISAQTKHPELAWELAKFLYFDKSQLGQRFLETNIIPPNKDAWDLPEFNEQNEHYSGQRLGRMYADLASEVPPVYVSALQRVGEAKLDQAYAGAVEHFKVHGKKGLQEAIRSELSEAAAYVRKAQKRQARLLVSEKQE